MSAKMKQMCPCGARAFSRDPHDTLAEEFDEAHAYCDLA